MIPLVVVPLGIFLLMLAGRMWQAGRMRAADWVVVAAGLVLMIGAAVVAWKQGVAADENGTEGSSLLPPLFGAVVGMSLVSAGFAAHRRRAR